MRLKGRVYGQAEGFIISLGPTNVQGLAVLSKMARSIPRLNDEYEDGTREQALQTLELLEADGSSEAFVALFRSPWWRGLWAVHVVTWCDDITMLMGDVCFHSNVIEQAMRCEDIIKRHLTESEKRRWTRLTASSGWCAAKRIMKTRCQWITSGGLPFQALFFGGSVTANIIVRGNS